MNIPDEAVEAAAKAAGLVFEEPANARDVAYIKLVLEAAAPHLMAAAWDECATAGLGWDENRETDFTTKNPYRKDGK